MRAGPEEINSRKAGHGQVYRHVDGFENGTKAAAARPAGACWCLLAYGSGMPGHKGAKPDTGTSVRSGERERRRTRRHGRVERLVDSVARQHVGSVRAVSADEAAELRSERLGDRAVL